MHRALRVLQPIDDTLQVDQKIVERAHTRRGHDFFKLVAGQGHDARRF